MIYKVLSINTLPLASAERRDELSRQLAERPACAWHEPGKHGFLSTGFWHHQVVEIDPDGGTMRTLGVIDPRDHTHVDQINAAVQHLIDEAAHRGVVTG